MLVLIHLEPSECLLCATAASLLILYGRNNRFVVKNVTFSVLFRIIPKHTLITYIMANITSFNCPCGNQDPQKARHYDGMLGYEAVICTDCGKTHDHNGCHEADEFSKSYVGIV